MKKVFGKILSVILGLIVLVASFIPGPAQASPARDSFSPRWIPSKPTHITIMVWQSQTAIEVKFAEGTSYRVRGDELITLGHDNLTALQATLKEYPLQSIQRLFTGAESEISTRRTALEAVTNKHLPDLNLWYRFTVKKGTHTEALIDALNALPDVEIAYPAMVPAPLPTPNFVAQQGYLNPATPGVDAKYAWTKAGGAGNEVTIVDIEYSFNQSHEDLPNIPIIGGQEYHGFGDDHGTAVLGELSAKNNGLGITGIAYGAVIEFSSACMNSADCYYDPANAINTAQANTTNGDVILIEQQNSVCGLVDYGPLEWDQAVYDAIEIATSAGLNVVEAAGNGNVSLDGAGCNNEFNRATRDSGAIIVGAGAPPNFTQTDRSRLSFSSYGSRVDVQGWGRNVATTGYGDLYSGTGQDQWYTAVFAGTSSASPIVAGSVALLSSIAKQKGIIKSPAWIRSTLVSTGSPQQAAPGYPVSQHIGPQPNLKAAIATLAPAAFHKSNPSSGAINQPTSLTLAWGGSARATSYQYCYSTTNPCTNWIDNGTATSKALTGLAQHTTYHWNVKAINRFGTTYANGSSIAVWSFTTRRLTTAIFQSVGAQDGWVLESTAASNVGGTMNAATTTFQLGDDARNRQYKAILSFNTAALPDTAVIQSAVIKIDQSGLPVGTNPFNSLGSLWVDIRKGWFGTKSALELADYSATASAAKVGAFNPIPSSARYSVTLNAPGRSNINKTTASTGLTQFRLHFALNSNKNNIADFMKFFSGGVGTATARPQLIVIYYLP